MLRTAHLGSASQTASISTGAAQLAVAGASSAGWLSAGIAGPIGLAIGGIGLALSAIFGRKGPKQKVISTQIVNEIEPQLKANVQAYLAGERTTANQQAALANFDQAWAYLISNSACGSPDLGDPGKACIKDRARGGQWDWFALYRDPIANDPDAGTDDVTSVLTSVSSSSWFWPLAAIAVGVLL